jgi:hypothetical protein
VKGETVQRPEIEILFSPEAQGEFEAIQQTARPLLRDWARRYLEDLLGFPPEGWVDLRHRSKGVYFKSDSHIPFDIQGRVFFVNEREVEKVIVTRFRIRGGRTMG